MAETPASLPEPLCGNPEALITPRGFSKKNPCGNPEAWGFGWCNSKDYNDWIAAYILRINSGFAQYKDLVKWKEKKLEALTQEEKEFGMLLEEHKLLYKAIQEQSYKIEDMTSQQFSKRISDIMVKTEELNCLIENIQSAIIDSGGTIKPTGIIEGSRKPPTSTATYIGYTAAALAALWLYKQVS